eukprot:TRINITY_DN15530_c0_g1_i1.p1 TRINITY_DN15530_c0_g1~~TRINITY_DN15530_c0_g1_i1.p1  ORF type:complete len:809 (-),score=116.88 TRINITY_DN15530_c0_g1_i1:59-2485(-)
MAICRGARAVVLESRVIRCLQDAVEDKRQLRAKHAEDLWRKLSLFGLFDGQVGQEECMAVAKKVAAALAEMLADFEGAEAVRDNFVSVANSFRDSEASLQRLSTIFGQNLKGFQTMQNTIERCAAEAIRLLSLFEGNVGDMRVQLHKTLKTPKRCGMARFPDDCLEASASETQDPDHIAKLLQTLERDLCDTPMSAMITAAEKVNTQVANARDAIAPQPVPVTGLSEPGQKTYCGPAKVIFDMMEVLRPCLQSKEASAASACVALHTPGENNQLGQHGGSVRSKPTVHSVATTVGKVEEEHMSRSKTSKNPSALQQTVMTPEPPEPTTRGPFGTVPETTATSMRPDALAVNVSRNDAETTQPKPDYVMSEEAPASTGTSKRGPGASLAKDKFQSTPASFMGAALLPAPAVEAEITSATDRLLLAEQSAAAEIRHLAMERKCVPEAHHQRETNTFGSPGADLTCTSAIDRSGSQDNLQSLASIPYRESTPRNGSGNAARPAREANNDRSAHAGDAAAQQPSKASGTKAALQSVHVSSPFRGYVQADATLAAEACISPQESNYAESTGSTPIPPRLLESPSKAHGGRSLPPLQPEDFPSSRASPQSRTLSRPNSVGTMSVSAGQQLWAESHEPQVQAVLQAVTGRLCGGEFRSTAGMHRATDLGPSEPTSLGLANFTVTSLQVGRSKPTEQSARVSDHMIRSASEARLDVQGMTMTRRGRHSSTAFETPAPPPLPRFSGTGLPVARGNSISPLLKSKSPLLDGPWPRKEIARLPALGQEQQALLPTWKSKGLPPPITISGYSSRQKGLLR